MKCLPVLFTEDGNSVYRTIGSFLFKVIANHLKRSLKYSSSFRTLKKDHRKHE
jgi:chaperonin cofactor prefoldin